MVNVYLAIVARHLPAAEYAYFGAFWSLAQVAGFGAFLPIEQETARLLQIPRRRFGVLKSTLVIAMSLAAAELAVIVVGWPLVSRALGGHVAMVLALAVLCIVSAGQFVVRGALIGGNVLGRHAATMVLDSVLRVGFAALVAATVTAPGSPQFAWTLVAAIGCAHAPQLLAWLTRPRRSPGEADSTADRLGSRAVWSAVAPLLLGSLCAQLLLNGPPVLVPALASNVEDATRAGQFVAAFTLTRLPLFLVVPMQTALLPILTATLHMNDRAALHRWLRLLSLGLVALGAAAVVVGFVAGPWLLRLIFGEQYALPGADIALLSLGVAVYIGLVIVTQVLVAAVRHRMVAWSWLSGVLVAVVVLAVVPELLLRAELAFLLGSTTAWLVGTVLALIDRQERVVQRVQ
jgi:O-antigen/teichoic acid export membrane protein